MLLLHVLQSVTDFIKSTSDITKCKNYYKVKGNKTFKKYIAQVYYGYQRVTLKEGLVIFRERTFFFRNIELLGFK